MNEVVAPFLVGEFFGVERTRDVRFAAAGKFGFGAWPAPGAFDQQHVALSLAQVRECLSALVGDGGGAVFVDKMARIEAVQRERRVQFMRLVFRDGVRVRPARTRRRLEAARAPAAN